MNDAIAYKISVPVMLHDHFCKEEIFIDTWPHSEYNKKQNTAYFVMINHSHRNQNAGKCK